MNDARLRSRFVQPCYDAGEIERKESRLAMSVGKSCHYKLGEIQRRHFEQTAQLAGFSKTQTDQLIEEVIFTVKTRKDTIEKLLPTDFLEEIHSAVQKAMSRRLAKLRS